MTVLLIEHHMDVVTGDLRPHDGAELRRDDRRTARPAERSPIRKVVEAYLGSKRRHVGLRR